MKPAGYPLPWCEQLDVAYWQVNVGLCRHLPVWSYWQAHKPMKEIVPVIDWLLDHGGI